MAYFPKKQITNERRKQETNIVLTVGQEMRRNRMEMKKEAAVCRRQSRATWN